MSINLYVEGGGDARIDRLARDLFRSLFQGHVQQLPHVVMGRGGNDTIKKFVAERRRGGSHVLLIDLEGPRSKSPLRVQFESVDSTLAEVEDRDLHCMVQFMEAWLLASESGLRGRYKPRKDAALPPWASPPVELESIPRDQIAKW